MASPPPVVTPPTAVSPSPPAPTADVRPRLCTRHDDPLRRRVLDDGVASGVVLYGGWRCSYYDDIPF
jgi:hypothetical protein